MQSFSRQQRAGLIGSCGRRRVVVFAQSTSSKATTPMAEYRGRLGEWGLSIHADEHTRAGHGWPIAYIIASDPRVENVRVVASIQSVWLSAAMASFGGSPVSSTEIILPGQTLST